MEVLFRTPAGSRLYGLANEDSDYDYYTVIETVQKNKKTFITHSIVGDVDETVVDFSTWVNQCMAGQPQALEAMFSQMALEDEIAEYREAFRAGTNYGTYFSIMKRLAEEHPDSYKHKRHILRLANNVKSLKETNRFNPTLGRVDKELINSLAKLPVDRVYDDALIIAGSLTST